MRPRYGMALYLRRALNPALRLSAMRSAVRTLKPFVASGTVDALAVTGVSGLIFGAILADRLKLDLIVVRKPSDTKKHSNRNIEGLYRPGHAGALRYLFVDDLVDTGATVTHVISELSTQKTTCVGWYLYDDDHRHDTLAWFESNAAALAAADPFTDLRHAPTFIP